MSTTFSARQIVIVKLCTLVCCSSQSQMDVDSGIETMEVDELEGRHEVKRRRVCTPYQTIVML